MINSKPKKYVQSFSPSLQGQPVKALEWTDRYKYLGVPVGREGPASLKNLKLKITKEADLITKSLLTDWQKIEALNVFILSKAFYYLRTNSHHSTGSNPLTKESEPC